MQIARKLDLDMSKVMGFWANTGQLLLSLEIPASLTISKKKKKLTLFSGSFILQFVEIRPSVAVEGAAYRVI
jgi:hypothetical protein